MEKAIDFCFRKEGTAESVVPTVDRAEAAGAPQARVVGCQAMVRSMSQSDICKHHLPKAKIARDTGSNPGQTQVKSLFRPTMTPSDLASAAGATHDVCCSKHAV